MANSIYLDNQATTPLDPAVLEVMLPFLTSKFGNPHSASHAYGWETEAAIDVARAQVSSLIKAQEPNEIYFTSGATEANNLAIKGTMQAYGRERPHMVTVNTEHKCVLETMRYCESMGFSLTVVPVNAKGLVEIDSLEKAITNKTAIVSVMAVQNEIGTIQDIKTIATLAHSKGALFHTDAAQGFGKIPLDVQDMTIDLMSISGHKIYGPKGVGALYVKKGVRLVSQIHGGTQEDGLRAGTQAPALCAGLGMAASLAETSMITEHTRIRHLQETLLNALINLYPPLVVNGSLDERWVGNLNISFPGINGDRLIANLRAIALSSGSACSSGSATGSFVLKALDLPKELISSSLRLGIGRFTTEEDIQIAIEHFKSALEKLGKL
ncbi:aminotransferase class V-fold PLP-dependent enzyme [Temperatibacter marinus]|uniref:Cysteine desulfurase n=1 Tax=Temperatibacter marinus TaxID=1456591 RepID=A0AA52EFL0_9PROT|nr:aminotransferase class V-fold PLP-dependent enzyme [Temperatibacter marinus]WND02208.1 aminotransferase class V-fold PLP-dependent enzyme [Temperatibacter marinus]